MSKGLKILVLPAIMFAVVSASEPPENTSEKPPEKKITVAVYPIKITGEDKTLEPVLTTLFITKLGQSNKLKVIEEAMMDEVLKRLDFANSDLCDNSQCQLQVGKMTPASKLIVPTLSKLGDKYIFSARVIDIETANIDFTSETKKVCKEDELDALIEDASFDLREKFGEKVVRPKPLAAVSSEKQNILGIVVGSAPGMFRGGVQVASVLPDSPCQTILKPGAIIMFLKPDGNLAGDAKKDAAYHLAGVADFVTQVSKIKPGAACGLLVYPSISASGRYANCVVPAVSSQ
jgi:hypothetical protein